MFLSIITLAACLLWLALEMYWHAQRMDSQDVATQQRIRDAFGYLKAQLPRGSVNLQKTVVVDYKAGFDPGYDWDGEDFRATQCPVEHESGVKLKSK